MEKFYKVSNKEYLESLVQDRNNKQKQGEVVFPFLLKHEILCDVCLVSGDGGMNKPFTEKDKGNINLWLEDKTYPEAIEKQLKKANKRNGMRGFKKNSKILKEFQDLCIEKQVIINIFETREGDYFKNLHLGGYSMKRFIANDDLYLRMISKFDFEPEYDGFEEINASEFYLALEAVKNE